MKIRLFTDAAVGVAVIPKSGLSGSLQGCHEKLVTPGAITMLDANIYTGREYHGASSLLPLKRLAWLSFSAVGFSSKAMISPFRVPVVV
jgi:hypothetical protein